MSTSIDTIYSSGEYFSDATRHQEDAPAKATFFADIFFPFVERANISIQSMVDVGCGSGDIVKLISADMLARGFTLNSVKGYDVSPHVLQLKDETVEYVYGDFSQTSESADLITLFDVIEHIPAPITYLQEISQKGKVVVLHIPLDNSWLVGLRNLHHGKLRSPGHLVSLDLSAALNLLAYSGLRVVDYQFTLGFFVARNSMTEKLLFPLRYVLAKISPWLLSKTLGGVSLAVIALTPTGVESLQSS